jgi:hypothetical protein
MSHGPCGRGGGLCAADAGVAVANMTPSGKRAIATAAAKIRIRVRRMGDLNIVDKLLSFICWAEPSLAKPESQLIARPFRATDLCR